jgi:hypothetical protein
MIAFLFTLALFAYWGIIGLAMVAFFPPRLRIVQTLLTAPSVGMATLLLPVFFINRLGYPVKDFALPLALTLFVVSALILIYKRPLFPARRMLPYAAILIAALLLSGWPMLLYGFDWVSYVTDDMANYCLAATRFLNHGFFDKPDMDVLISGQDYSLAYWFMHVAGHVRAGSELMLAEVLGVSGLNAHQVFMPVIMALHLALLGSATALTAGRGAGKTTPLIAMGLLAISPLNTFGALYQFLGQVGGIGLLCAGATLTYRPQTLTPYARLVWSNVPAVLILTTLFLWYPEVLPFFGMGWLLYVAVFLKFNRKQALTVVLPAAVVGAIVLAGLNRYAIFALFFMLAQTSGGFKSGGVDPSTLLFPYYLVPSGIPTLWGLQSTVDHFHEPWLSLCIALGMFLSAWFLVRLLPREFKRASPPAIMTIVMLVPTVMFVYSRNDYLLFKLAMYFQPFFCGVIAVRLSRLLYNKAWVGTTITGLVALMVLAVQWGYVTQSTGEGELIELPHASAKKISQQFDTLIHSLTNTEDTVFISTTTNLVLAKFEMLHSEGYRMVFPSNDYTPYIGWGKYLEAPARSSYSVRNVIKMLSDPSDDLPEDTTGQYERKALNDNAFIALRPEVLNGKHIMFISTAGTDMINHYRAQSENDTHYFQAIPGDKISNLLLYVRSSLGQHYYLGDAQKISFYQMEADPLFPGQSFASLGRRLLFMVCNPTPHPRMVMELTATITKQFRSQLPIPDVQGATVNFLGRGTGRVFSQPLEFTYIDGVPYISVDMGRDGLMFPEHKQGLMLLYGRDVSGDRRRITAFGRDISLVSEAEYQAITPPENLQEFPADLANKNLEYSGIYEDGWISERSFFMLNAKPGAKAFVVKGMVPLISSSTFRSTLQVSIDGKVVATKPLTLGNFEVRVPADKEGKHRIDLSFDHYQTLPFPDIRPIGGKIAFIGYTNN